MNFDGTLIKIGSYLVPLKYIKLDSYDSAPNQRQDIDSGVDNANGKLVRQTLSHTRSKIEFETPYLHLKDKTELMSNIKKQYVNYQERKVVATYYDDENDVYKTSDFYLPDIHWKYYHVDEKNKDIIYNPTRIALIEY